VTDDDKKQKKREARKASDEAQIEALRRVQEQRAKGPATGNRRPMQPRREQPWEELPNGERLYTDVLPEDASAYEAEDAGDVIAYSDWDGFEDDVYGPNHRRRGGSWDIPGT
jgi:hypothetical protein